MTSEITKSSEGPFTFLTNRRPQIESLLPEGLSYERFARTAINGIMAHPQSGKLMAADKRSLFAACAAAAADGLLLNSTEATLVVYGDKVSYIPMTQGLVKLARQSGEIQGIAATVVYSQDRFSYSPGKDDVPTLEADWFGDRGEPVGAYAVVSLKDGEHIVSILPKARIMAIGLGGRNGKQYDPQTGPHWTEWWRKTVIKNALKYAPRSSELDSAVMHDNEAHGEQFDTPDAVPDGTPVPSSAIAAVTSKMETNQ